MKKVLNILKKDPWLAPYKDAIEGRYEYVLEREKQLCGKDKKLSDFASGYLYYGLHKTDNGWVFREWAPNDTEIYLLGDFSQWKDIAKFKL